MTQEEKQIIADAYNLLSQISVPGENFCLAMGSGLKMLRELLGTSENTNIDEK